VIVRKDLSYSSPAVQAGHVIAEFCLHHLQSRIWNNHTLIYLEVNNLDELDRWMFKFEKRNIDISFFEEPDLNYELTAICGLVDEGEEGFLSDLNLLQ